MGSWIGASTANTQHAITHDHTYASSLVSSEEDLVSFKKPSSEEVVTHKEQEQAPLQELLVLSDECEDENKELGEEPLGQSKDASITVEVGTKNFIYEMKALNHLFVLAECQTGMDWLAVETTIRVEAKG